MAVATLNGPALLALDEDELALLYQLCALFPLRESPLRFVHDGGREPHDYEATFAALTGRGLLDGRGAPSAELAARLTVVSECEARVTVTRRFDEDTGRRDYFVAGGSAVEYTASEGAHRFGPLLAEAELAHELCSLFCAKATASMAPLELSAGDYLVFAVFARDVRAAPPSNGDASAMSIDEVLAYFDEPETKYVRTPSDDSWQTSIEALVRRGVLVHKAGGYELHQAFHALARQIVADHQQTIARLDFFDEDWFSREVQLYPAADALFRLGTRPDGTVSIQELTQAQLPQLLARIVTTLPGSNKKAL